ncbi:BnaA01g26930D [Brassica napus]|uniref:BnaA01g26930D protein n=1 Tax=Brassica napus TaxID=3708 RepID=A0A078G0H5_BRANA|nr:BnaA01g26930D [Brassica napus]
MTEKDLLYDTILARSFSKNEQKRLGYGAFVASLLFVFTLCTVFKPYLSPLPTVELQLPVNAGLRMLRITETQKPQASRSSSNATYGDSENLTIPTDQINITSNATTPQKLISSENHELSVFKNTSFPKNHLDSLNSTTNTPISKEQVVTEGNKLEKTMKPICKKLARTEICEINGDVRVHGKSATIHTAIAFAFSGNSTWHIINLTREKQRHRRSHSPPGRSRAFTNAGAIARAAKQIGFKVVVAEANADVASFAQTVNSCDVMLGVHGAGLTNMVFLPENAVVVQILPIGGFEWLAKTDFEEPSKGMNLRYLEYKIAAEESTLLRRYGRDHEVVRDPSAVGKRGWEMFQSVYLVQQNVSVDINRFRPVLVKAFELVQMQSV